jgi:carotenoid 1,2-hydratase
VREAHALAVGPSEVEWRGDALHVRFDETTVPVPRRIRGEIVVHPNALTRFVTPLDTAGRHRWGPIAPTARVEVALERPSLRWSGEAYVDSNEGDEPIDAPFADWDWSRARMADGSTAILYDVRQRDGANPVVAIRCDTAGGATPFEPPPRHPLAGTLWRVPRATRGEPEARPRVVETLEDTPFYVRSLVGSRLLGEDVVSMHESLSLDRFRTRWVKALLPFRMPRVR